MRIFRHYLRRQAILLTLADLIVLIGAAYSGKFPLFLEVPSFRMSSAAIFPTELALVGIAWIVLFVGGAYHMPAQQGSKETVIHLMGCFAVLALVLGAVGFSIPYLRWTRRRLMLPFLFSLLGVTAIRLSTLKLWDIPRFRERLLLVGSTPVADRLIHTISTVGHRGYELLGCVDNRSETGSLSNGFRILGKVSELERVAAEHRAGTIVVTLEDGRENLPLKPILDCKLRGIRVEDWPSCYERLTRRIGVENVRPSWMIFSDGFQRAAMTQSIKRGVDIGLSLLFLILGFPLFIFVALAIKFESRGPIFFRQERVGEGEKVFNVLKFRTMYEGAEQKTGPVWAAENDPRITRVGRFLRRSRLDEFPQIVNVLKGDMSFVGPRPERPEFVAMLQQRIPYYLHRLSVKPGITGWAQIRHPYGSTVDDALKKLEYDLYYVKNVSIFLDILILLTTVQVVVFGRGAR